MQYFVLWSDVNHTHYIKHIDLKRDKSMYATIHVKPAHILTWKNRREMGRNGNKKNTILRKSSCVDVVISFSLVHFSWCMWPKRLNRLFVYNYNLNKTCENVHKIHVSRTHSAITNGRLGTVHVDLSIFYAWTAHIRQLFWHITCWKTCMLLCVMQTLAFVPTFLCSMGSFSPMSQFKTETCVRLHTSITYIAREGTFKFRWQDRKFNSTSAWYSGIVSNYDIRHAFFLHLNFLQLTRQINNCWYVLRIEIFLQTRNNNFILIVYLHIPCLYEHVCVVSTICDVKKICRDGRERVRKKQRLVFYEKLLRASSF